MTFTGFGISMKRRTWLWIGAAILIVAASVVAWITRDSPPESSEFPQVVWHSPNEGVLRDGPAGDQLNMAILSSSHDPTPTGLGAPHELKAALIPSVPIGMARKAAGEQVYSDPRTYKITDGASKDGEPKGWFKYRIVAE
jgi:hypothetical protein